jgi:hypothetical protein
MFGGVAPMLEGVAIALRCAFGVATVHTAAPIRHRRRLTWRPGTGPGMAARAQVHG